MIKILQFGEGNFLRTFADAYFDTLNKEGAGEYEVHIVKPIPGGSLEKFVKQNNAYHIVLRGVKNGKETEEIYKIDAVKSAFSPFDECPKYLALARDCEVKLVVSNTTEAGICFSESDKFEDFETATYPAKLTKWLYERYRAGLGGVYILPVELIENNADELFRCVEKYVALWRLPEAFRKWNAEQNFYCNTLVDRIVSGYPRDEETRNRVWQLIGETDELVSVGEPFGLWAIEKKGGIENYVKEGAHNVEVVLTNDINYYKKRKVRVLNGSHTNLVAAGLMLGKETVYDCMKDERLSAFVTDTLEKEIIPFVSEDVAATTAFAHSVTERFLNPYLNHRLISIALNSISKWRARVLPSFKDYYAAHGKIAPKIAVGFSYLIALYYTKHGELKDEAKYLECFAMKQPLEKIMQNAEMWGEDLTAYAGFYETVKENTERIIEGEVLI
ncbi:MAG: tagaturonate reductase [Candidatus Borkfalkiaceae bacterium]|nr:tagaturonate reductase [Clostridia bacterium]MDY6224109.1 tagaturonate reductase [Christensenellaceae bacterium]